MVRAGARHERRRPPHRRQVLPRATTSCTSAGSTTFPTALEGALKLKEISYIHAEGYPAAEMKHGPIALVDEHTPSVFIVPQGGVYDKVMSNMEEIKARGGPVIAIVDEGDSHAAELADDVIRVPAVPDFLQPIVTVDPAATAGLPHRHPPRLRRRQAAESGEERDGGVKVLAG